MKQAIWLYVLCAFLLPVQAQDAATIKRAVTFLKKVPPRATLTHVKPILPKGTKLALRRSVAQGNGKTWIVQPFSGPLNGQLIFFNTRQTPQRKAGMPPPPPLDGVNTLLMPKDAIHSVEIFLAPLRKNWRKGALTAETKRYVSTLANQLGKPAGSKNTGETGGPDAVGWTASWKFPGGRKIGFIHSFALMSSNERPLLTLSFGYSQIYRS